MNLININQTQTMSSREVAELTGKRHDNVKADIEKMLVDLKLNVPDFSGTYIATNGNTSNEFNLPKRECLILVSGYSIALRAKIIDRWQELESKQITPKELSRKDILLLALEAEERAEIAEARIERLVHSGRCHTTRQLAKEAGFKSAQELNAVLFNSKIIFKERGIWVLYSKYADKGYQEIKQQEFDNGHLGYTAEWTAAGREFVLDFCEKL